MEEKKRGRPKKEVEEVRVKVESIEEEKIRLNNRLKQLEEKARIEQEELDIINQKAEEDLRQRRDFEEWQRHKISVKRLVEERFPTKPSLMSEIDMQDIEEEDPEERKVSEDLEKKIKNVDDKKSITFWGKIFKKNKVNKEGKVALILLHPHGDATTQYQDVEKDGSFKVGNEQYYLNEHCIYRLRVKRESIPLCILPTWTMIPLGTKAWFELTQERRGMELSRMILNAIKKEEAIKMEDGKKKGKMSAKTIWLLLAVVVGGYIFLKSKGG